MDKETKYMFANILGEIYRLQKRIDPKMLEVNDAVTYGLLNNFELVIDEHFGSIADPANAVTGEEFKIMCRILNEISKSPEKLEAFSGYNDIEHAIEGAGISRIKAVKILKFLYANGSFKPMIDKMHSPNSPEECRMFSLEDWER